MKIKVTQQQRDNALEALNVMWPSVPEENVYPELERWRNDLLRTKPPTCGTVACFGGWCAWWPPFVAQGIAVELDGRPVVAKFGSTTGALSSMTLFGESSLFDARYPNGEREWFDRLPRIECETDHAHVTRRLQWLIENSEVV